MGLLSSGKTDIGRKRKTNQDSIFMNREKHLYVVADGMGGHNGGDIASAMAVKTIPEYVFTKYGEDPIITLINALKHANACIFRKSLDTPLLKGMGTTTVGLYFKGDTLYIANVGDSRCYLINRNNIYQMSQDHSLVQEKLNLGLYGRIEAAADPQKNVLVRTIGFEKNVDVDIFTYKVSRNDILFICSDGLHGKVSDHDMLYLVRKYLPQNQQHTQEMVDTAVDVLIGQANQNGGQDNISVILLSAQ
ncbi:MAG: Stp1/IreP family PP2C-type Ser/Thr phosphatase [Halobacteriovoraceae bacterium]|nr:Stp1/IreP family PP2C-type Ser/Thr phosphatase [Halobacteriovoraceae bacterium]